MENYSEELLQVASENGLDVEDYIESSNETDLEHIAHLIEQGFTSGIRPTWHIDIQMDEEEEDLRCHEVARLVRDGFASGYSPTFSLEVSAWSWEDYQ